MNLLNRIKNIVKVARLVSSDDSGNYTRGEASYMGKDVPIMLMHQYGHAHRPPKNSMCLLFAQNGQESNGIAIVDDPKRRTLRNLKEGESALYNQVTGDYVYLKEGGEVEIKTSTVTILTGGTTVTIVDGQVTIEAADVTLNGNLQVNGDIGSTGTITGDVDVIGGGKSLLNHTHIGSPTAPTGPVSPTGAPT